MHTYKQGLLQRDTKLSSRCITCLASGTLLTVAKKGMSVCSILLGIKFHGLHNVMLKMSKGYDISNIKWIKMAHDQTQSNAYVVAN